MAENSEVLKGEMTVDKTGAIGGGRRESVAG
jgi:hypothetical protein